MATVHPIKEAQAALIDRLASEWLEAKADEVKANTKRIEIENQLLELTPSKESGTAKIEGDFSSVAVRFGVTHKVDARALAHIWKKIPEAISARLFRNKPELVKKEFDYIRDNEPDLYRTLSEAISSKPSKPSIAVKPLES